MIKICIGGIGSGKTTSMVRDMFIRRNKTFLNFNVKLPNSVRLETDHIIKKEIVDHTARGKPIEKTSLNFDFWNEQKGGGFDICLDEVHNILHSRRSMSKWNTLFSMWLAQIRKILGGNEQNHLYLISQKLERIDVSARDLAGEITYCHIREFPTLRPTTIWNGKQFIKKALPETYIIKHKFEGTYCQEKYNSWLMGDTDSEDSVSYFYANPFFKYFDSYEILDFGNEVYI